MFDQRADRKMTWKKKQEMSSEGTFSSSEVNSGVTDSLLLRKLLREVLTDQHEQSCSTCSN